MNSPDNSNSAPSTNGNGRRQRVLMTISAVFIVIAIVSTAWWYFIASQRETTDDAYVGGDQANISAQVPGTVVAVLVKEMQRVSAGQPLLRLNPIDADTRLQQAASVLAQTVRQFRQSHAQTAQLDALVVSRRLELEHAQQDLKQREPLVADNAIAAEELRHARDAVTTATAALRQAEAQARAAHALVDRTTAQDNPAVLQAKSSYLDAWIAAQRNVIVAPMDGYVAQKNVQLGQRVQAGQTLMNVVSLDTIWVDANFKEGQLRHLRLGQPVEITSDLYGSSVVFHGQVQNFSAGTGAAFALLPAQNASGNWIKVVQRVPVRIALNREELQTHPLRLGLSTAVKVDTHDRSGAVLPQTVPDTRADSALYMPDLVPAEQQAKAIIQANL